MTATTASSNAPGSRRARSRVETNLRGALIALLVAVVLEIGFVAAIIGFNSSLSHHAPGYSKCPPTSYTIPQPAQATNRTTVTADTVPNVPGLAVVPPKSTNIVVHVDCGVVGAGLTAAHIIEVLLALAGLVAPAFGLLAVLRALRSRRLVSEQRFSDARIAAEDSRDAVWYVVGFGLAMVVVTFVAVLFAGSDGAVRSALWNWKYPLRSRNALLKAFLWNVGLFFAAEAIVLVWALLIAVVRQLPGKPTRPIRWLAIAYTDVFRGVPAIIVIYLVCLGLPLGKVAPFTHLGGNPRVFWLGVLALTMVYGAYVAEVYRAGIESIHWSQAAAARSLGLSQWQTYRYVIIPQAVRRIIPPLLNDCVALQKDTALVGFVGLIEVLSEANLLDSHYFNLTPVTFAAVLFLIPTIPLTRYVDRLIKREQLRTQAH
ncbi:MAG TPA: amino acid ABC transporter permease [Acidimicrobiia bacterium]|jgi:polar amino acid transport system permease protein